MTVVCGICVKKAPNVEITEQTKKIKIQDAIKIVFVKAFHLESKQHRVMQKL